MKLGHLILYFGLFGALFVVSTSAAPMGNPGQVVTQTRLACDEALLRGEFFKDRILMEKTPTMTGGLYTFSKGNVDHLPVFEMRVREASWGDIVVFHNSNYLARSGLEAVEKVLFFLGNEIHTVPGPWRLPSAQEAASMLSRPESSPSSYSGPISPRTAEIERAFKEQGFITERVALWTVNVLGTSTVNFSVALRIKMTGHNGVISDRMNEMLNSSVASIAEYGVFWDQHYPNTDGLALESFWSSREDKENKNLEMEEKSKAFRKAQAMGDESAEQAMDDFLLLFKTPSLSMFPAFRLLFVYSP